MHLLKYESKLSLLSVKINLKNLVINSRAKIMPMRFFFSYLALSLIYNRYIYFDNKNLNLILFIFYRFFFIMMNKKERKFVFFLN